MVDKVETIENPTSEFAIQRLYIKDASFEAPGTPAIFREEWKPEVNLDLNNHHEKIADEVFEVTLKGTVTVKSSDTLAFIAEVTYAGIFTIKGFEDEQFDQVVNSFCPNVLFPYMRETVTDMVSRGSFPQLVLAPVNFDALYHQQLEQKAKETAH